MDLAESLAIDSLWLSDRVVSEALSLEPVVALSWVAARTRKMKFGTSVLALPLRNPTVLAKELATLDFLSGGRLLLAVGLGRDDDTELQACGIHRSERTGRPPPPWEQPRTSPPPSSASSTPAPPSSSPAPPARPRLSRNSFDASARRSFRGSRRQALTL